MHSEDAFFKYYTIQSGGAMNDIGPLYYNQRLVQQGRGIGNFFASLYKYLKPVFVSGFSALKNQAIKTGSSVLNELGTRPFKDIIVDHGKQALNDLGHKVSKKFQDGSGLFSYRNDTRKYKKAANSKKSTKSSKAKKQKAKIAKKKKIKTRILDIFSKRN